MDTAYPEGMEDVDIADCEKEKLFYLVIREIAFQRSSLMMVRSFTVGQIRIL